MPYKIILIDFSNFLKANLSLKPIADKTDKTTNFGRLRDYAFATKPYYYALGLEYKIFLANDLANMH